MNVQLTFPDINEITDEDVSNITKDAVKTRNRPPINNQCIALITDIPSELFQRPIHDQRGYNANHDTVRTVLMLQRLTGGIGFPGGKREDSDKTDIDAALREFHEETLFNLEPLIGHKVFIDEYASYAYDNRSNVISGMHVAETDMETFFQINATIQGNLCNDHSKMVEHSRDLTEDPNPVGMPKIFGAEISAVYPVFLTDFSCRNLQKQSAFTLVSYQLDKLLNGLYSNSY